MSRQRMGSVGRRCGAALLAVVLALVMSACQYMFPTVPMFPDYVVNRDGHYYAGARCPGLFVFAQANWMDEIEDGSEWPDYPRPFWEVDADPPGVAEVLLFEPGQPGVDTIIDGQPNTTGRRILVTMLRPGNTRPIDLVLNNYGSLRPGQTNIPNDDGTLMSWDDFAKIPDGDFGWC